MPLKNSRTTMINKIDMVTFTSILLVVGFVVTMCVVGLMIFTCKIIDFTVKNYFKEREAYVKRISDIPDEISHEFTNVN